MRLRDRVAPPRLKLVAKDIRTRTQARLRRLPGDAVRLSVGRLGALGEYQFAIFLGEWPDPGGGGMSAEAVINRLALLEPGTSGMVSARRL